MPPPASHLTHFLLLEVEESDHTEGLAVSYATQSETQPFLAESKNLLEEH